MKTYDCSCGGKFRKEADLPKHIIGMNRKATETTLHVMAK